MISRLYSAAIIGVDAQIVEVEVDIQKGLEKLNIVGLPDKAVQEAKERVISSIKNSTAEFVHSRITVNLAPANIPKSGPGYDLPVALGILVASSQIQIDYSDSVFVGELSLEGNIRHVDGVVVIADAAKKNGFRNIYVPHEDMKEALSVDGINVFPVKNLDEIIHNTIVSASRDENFFREIESPLPYQFDFKNIIGQSMVKRVLEIAAVGNHNLLLFGTPGSGKSLMAKTYPSILPPLTMDEKIEVTRIYSVSGNLNKNSHLIHLRPFRSPHHTSSEISLVGGGRIPIPGEVSLSHHGVLFLDEFPEFSSRSIEALRQPMEDGIVSISRASGTITFPSKFQLIAAMNPCKCGWKGDPERECKCSFVDVNKYLSKVSGPIIDRFDLQIFVPRVKTTELSQNLGQEESSQTIKERVIKAINFGQEHENIINITPYAKQLLLQAVDNLKISARGYFRLLRVARSISFLAQSDQINEEHITEAVGYRMFTDFR